MDVHNQQLVFPTIVVCPIESYDLNRTYDLAFYKLGYALNRVESHLFSGRLLFVNEKNNNFIFFFHFILISFFFLVGDKI